jgi:hypothetical protein
MTTAEVFIPSTMRWDKVHPKFGIIVVHEIERERYAHHNPGRKIITHTRGTIGQIRDWLMHISVADIVFMIDDDIVNDDLQEGIKAMADRIAEEGLAAAGMGARFMVHERLKKDGEWSRFGYLTKAWGLRKSYYFQVGADMSPWPCHEDTYMACVIGANGHIYERSNKYLAKEAKNYGGGCDSYRTDHMIIQYMKELAKQSPEYVQVKNSKVSNNGRRLGVSTRVAWSRFDCHSGALPRLERPTVLWQ